MTQAMITTAAQHLSPVADMRSQLEYVAQFVRDKGYRDDFGRDASLMLRTTERSYIARGQTWQPDVPQLCNALIYLAAVGVSLNPVRQESALLCFFNKRSGMHDVTPSVMVRGLTRIASEMYPIVDITSQVVMSGDEWHYRETATGPELQWAPGATRATLKGLQDLSPLAGAWCRVTLWDPRIKQVRTVIGALVGEELHEKLRANRNAKDSKDGSAWGSHFLAMVEKTIQKYTLTHRLPLWGEPAAAMALVSESESHSRALLSEYAAQRGLELPETTAPARVPAARRLIDAAPEIPASEPRPVRAICNDILACTDIARLAAFQREIDTRIPAEQDYLMNVLADRKAKLEEQR